MSALGSAISTTSWKQETEKLNGTISEEDDLGPSLLKEVLTMLKELKNEKFEEGDDIPGEMSKNPGQLVEICQQIYTMGTAK